MMVLLPIIILVKSFPYAAASGLDPIRIRISSAYTIPKALRISVIQMKPATPELRYGKPVPDFSPILLATIVLPYSSQWQ
jgi:hypothetical protein